MTAILETEPLLSFNEFIDYAAHHGVGINDERPKFHAFCVFDGAEPRTIDQWWETWQAFCAWQDAFDERDTMLDARYA